MLTNTVKDDRPLNHFSLQKFVAFARRKVMNGSGVGVLVMAETMKICGML